MIWFGWVLWHINHCGLFNAKSSLYIYILNIYDMIGLVGLYGISTIVDHLMPNLYIYIYIYIYIYDICIYISDLYNILKKALARFYTNLNRSQLLLYIYIYIYIYPSQFNIS